MDCYKILKHRLKSISANVAEFREAVSSGKELDTIEKLFGVIHKMAGSIERISLQAEAAIDDIKVLERRLKGDVDDED